MVRPSGKLLFLLLLLLRRLDVIFPFPELKFTKNSKNIDILRFFFLIELTKNNLIHLFSLSMFEMHNFSFKITQSS